MDGCADDHCGLKPDRYNNIIKLLKQVAEENNIQNVQIELAPGCEKGDGYMGEKHTAVLTGDNKSIKVFIKGAPTEEKIRLHNDGDLRNYFLIEIIMYEHIYPAFLKFQEEKHIVEPFKNILNVLATSTDLDQEILVMPDAREIGFHLWDRKKQMNQAHVEIVFKQYGKFHACSYAMKEQQPDLFQDLVNKLPKDPFDRMVQDMRAGMTDMANKAKGIFDPIKEVGILERFCEFIEDMMDIMQTTIKKDDFAVLTHGDCWCNNMLFKYTQSKDHSTPADICLIDFQLSRLGSPVMDLSYFLYSSADASVYADLDHLLRVYHTSLSNHLRALGCDPDKLFSLAELKNQWKEYCNFGVVMAMLLMKIVLMEKDETVDVNKVLEESDDILSGFNKETKNDTLYYQRLKSLLQHLYDYDLFQRFKK